jgi:ubiquinone/menaquinone biosynthesis C-methylase UbiE
MTEKKQAGTVASAAAPLVHPPSAMPTRVLEPEVMDTLDEARAYDAMDHRGVNEAFVTDALALSPTPRRVLDLGTGTGLIAILLATRLPNATVTAVDLAGEMLRLAARNVARAGLAHRIALARVDARELPYAPGDFDLVVSNSVVHHVPAPRALFAEIARVAGERAGVFVRDLCRPESEAEVAALVERHAAHEPSAGRELFRASLRAALTADEARALAAEAGLRGVQVRTTSDRHWTLARG